MTEAEQLFEQVYRTYGPSLYRFCLIQMKNPADAEDILQEVFCKRLYRAPVFASPDHERRWLFRVALFEQVYRTYGPSLYRFCLIQMKNPADAEDILQEVFCKRLYRAPVFASPDHERRWLFRVALNQCRDAWKRSNRSELPLEAASAAVTPEELGLLDHVAALPESQRTVLHLHYYEGYTLREIARLLGVTVPTVKMRLKRGRDALRNTWEESL